MRELGSAAFLLVAGLLALAEAGKLPIGTVGAPGPGFFPFSLAAGVSVVALGLVVRSLRGQEAPTGLTPAPARRRQLITAIVALFAYAFVLEQLGFILTTVLLMIVLFRVVQRQRWPLAVGGAVASAALSHLVFKVWLGVRLPPGPWGF